MAKQTKTDSTTKTTVTHSETTILSGKCRLAAIAAIAEPMPIVATAYANQAQAYLEQAETASDGSVKDSKQVLTSKRWVEAAFSAANGENH